MSNYYVSGGSLVAERRSTEPRWPPFYCLILRKVICPPRWHNHNTYGYNVIDINILNPVIMVSLDQNNIITEEISIVVYVDEYLDEQNKKRVQYQLSRVGGIQSVEFDKFRPHLLFIRHSHLLIESRKILGLLRSYDFHVQLIVGD